MPDQKIKLTSAGLTKLESTATTGRSWATDQMVEAIIKVGSDDYVPPDVEVRARIDKRMFTAKCVFGTIAQLESDPEVQSVAVSRALRVINEKPAKKSAAGTAGRRAARLRR